MNKRSLFAVAFLVIGVSLSACLRSQAPTLYPWMVTDTQQAALHFATETEVAAAMNGTWEAKRSATAPPSPTASSTLRPGQPTPTPIPATATPNGPQKQDFEKSVASTTLFGSQFTDEINGLTSDRQGNVYVACVCDLGTASWGTYVGQALLKFNGAGELLWKRPQGGSGGLFDQAVATDGAGNVIMVGNLPFPNGPGPSAYVVEYDGVGNQVWKHGLPADLSDVAADEAGNIYVSGRMGPDEAHLTNFIRKYSSAGQELWTQQLSQGVNSLSLKLAVGPNDKVILVGSVSDALPGQTSLGGEDLFIIQDDATGQAARVQQFGSPQNDYILDAAMDNSGDLYVAYQNDQIMMAKYDSSGKQVWTQSLGPAPKNSTWVKLATVGDNGPYVLLNSSWPLSSSLAEVRKLNSAGAEVWSRSYPATWPGALEFITADETGSLYLAGTTSSPLPGSTQTFGNDDVFLLKMNP